MPDADLILHNARVYTLSSKHPKAQAIAIKSNRILAVGSADEILKLKTPKTKTIDLHGKTAFPGFVDCHVHLRSFAKTLEQVELRDVVSMMQLQQRLRQAAEEKASSTWITARGFEEEKFKEKCLPTRYDLDQAVPDKPVLITRVCGHLSVANSKALRLAGITKRTEFVGSGKIEKNPKTGEPTGVLLEDAYNLIAAVIPKPSKNELLRIYEKACKEATEKGLTCVHFIVNDSNDIKILQQLRRQNKLKLRIRFMVPVECLNDLVEEKFPHEDDMIKMGSIKIYADGSFGARTAALKEPYTDDKTTRGILIYPQRKLEKLLQTVHEKGYQLAIHAIGDRAMEHVLDAVERVLKAKPKADHRHRIEHASILNKELIRRMHKLKVIASIQPHFVVSDFWTTKRLGKRRARYVYPFKTIIKNGITACGGSDCPIELIDPLLGVWAAVTRTSFPQERLSIDEAIRLYTVNAAFASHEEGIKGTIEPGKLADLTILSQDPYAVEPDDVCNMKVGMIIVDGEIVYADEH